MFPIPLRHWTFAFILVGVAIAGGLATTPAVADKRRGGGVVDGDGFPMTAVPTALVEGIVNEAELRALANTVDRVAPNLAIRFHRVLDHLNSGSYQLYRMDREHGAYATVHFAPTRKDRVPTGAQVILWREFGQLSDAPAEAQSKFMVMVGAVLALAATGEQEITTEELAQALCSLHIGTDAPSDHLKRIAALEMSLLGPNPEDNRRYPNGTMRDEADWNEGRLVDGGNGPGQVDIFALDPPARSVVSGVPQETLVRQYLTRAAQRVPSASALVLGALERFVAGANYRMYNVASPGSEHFLKFRHGPEHRHGLFALAEVQIFPHFYDLPIESSQLDDQSQVGAILHELVHVALTDRDEGATKVVALALYKLGKGAEVSAAEMSLIRQLISGPGFRLPITSITPIFAASLDLRDACDVFPMSHPIAIGARTFTFPQLPPRYVAAMKEDPFFVALRDWCWLKHPTGSTLIMPRPEEEYWPIVDDGLDQSQQMREHVKAHPLFQHPYIAGLIFDHFRGAPYRMHVSGSFILGFRLDDSAIFRGWRQWTKHYGRKGRVLANAELEQVIPGYASWFALFAAANPERKSDLRAYVSYRMLNSFPRHWLGELAMAYPQGFTLTSASDVAATRITVPRGFTVDCRVIIDEYNGENRNMYSVRYNASRVWLFETATLECRARRGNAEYRPLTLTYSESDYKTSRLDFERYEEYDMPYIRLCLSANNHAECPSQ